ncbi:SAP30-binding protein [Quillaja saponaria]|uniref:SAP30-binding protein n=1 Tax=Quillaja saponaria TaxID=32244 RepID=A0AAD7M2F4_QUISA|nr:SAP30-binding protein [Quillaja saponaria]KAJ7968721.1 SAP30-binding protein [Quillaja saponaria]
MASRKKASEGIALLSMYNDDEEDDEMEDVEEDREGGDDEQLEENGSEARMAEVDSMDESDRMVVGDSVIVTTPSVVNDSSTSEKSTFGTSTPRQLQVNLSVSTQQQRLMTLKKSGRGTLTIVDYGHDEVAMSPEAEEGEIEESGCLMLVEDLQTANGDFQDRMVSGTVEVSTPSNQAASSQFFGLLQSGTENHSVLIESEDAEYGEAVNEEQKVVYPLNKFLPPHTAAKCSEELQKKINKFLEYKNRGKSFNAEVRNRKDYRNPDFLLHAVSYQDIDQIGSCFRKDVFDPHGYDPSDYYDELEIDMKRESDRKEQEKKKAQKVGFVSSGTQPGIIAAAPKFNLPVPDSTEAASDFHLVPATSDAINRDSRQNKKSKWDKVDGDRKNPLPPIGQDSASTAGAAAKTARGRREKI